MKSTDETCGYCQSKRRELRERSVRGGSVQFVHQCLDCGAPVSQPVARPKYRVPKWDEALHERGKNRYAKQIREESAERRAEWFRQHNVYLRTDKWLAKRVAVLERSRGLCEGCRAARATQVHHLTYDHWQEELLWELVAVCEECHEKCHAHMTNEQ